jgi:hypothetical protein
MRHALRTRIRIARRPSGGKPTKRGHRIAALIKCQQLRRELREKARV